ncbi:GH92 family glycosyl hydrolase [Luteimicrobium sp. NPDC057192]|uniref:GH92 family glycosyl hydrolase n=1 Tax=Luteimicrobium sp. NPDC057192 TaxID=3346042 RepID=UPI0036305C25
MTGLVSPVAQADDAPVGGAFSSSFEADQPVALTSTGYSDPVNVTGAWYANGSLLPLLQAVTASDPNPGNESPGQATDNDSGTKWLSHTPTGWLQYQFASPQTARKYTLTSANDSAGRDPKSWVLQGSSDGTTWVDLDTQTDAKFTDRFVTNTYSITTPAAYAYYRLDITANSGEPLLQLADFDLLDGSEAPSDPAPIKAQVGSGPAAGTTSKGNVGFTGTHALGYAGTFISDGPASSTDTLFDDVDIPIGADTELAYKVYPTLGAKEQTYPATYVALDAVLDDGTRISQKAGLTDQYGFGASAKAQGEAKALFANQWNAVRFDLSSLAGHSIKKILLDYDDPKGVKGTSFTGWVDDVAVQKIRKIDDSSRLNFVDTRRGTNSSSSFSRGTNIPAAAMPNGFNFLTPMTDGGSTGTLYEYQRANNGDNLPTLQAIGISHEPSIWMGDRDQLGVMPSTSATPDATLGTRALTFQHANETARPDLYQVTFENKITTAVTPTDHGAVYRFDFPGSTGSVIVDKVGGSAKLTVAPDGSVSGWTEGGGGAGMTRMFVSGQFDRTPDKAAAAAGNRASAQYASFDTSSDKSVELRLATSFISQDQARKNLDLEVTGRSFEEVNTAARAAWDDRLDVIDVDGATQEQKVSLYSDLYRLNLYPNSQYENTGTADAPVYRHASPVAATTGAATDTQTNAKVVDGKIYVNNGFWDTYRTVWPLYSFLYPKLADELVDGFVQQYREGGWVARWSSPGYADMMTGTSSDVAFADAYINGSVDAATALEAYDAALKNATVLSPTSAVGRKALDTSIFLGYTPDSQGESVSWALEGYINDYGIGRMAAKLATDPATPEGRRAELKEESETFLDRATNYVKMFDPSTGFFRPKTASGAVSGGSSFDPAAWWGPYTETDAWNFAFHAPFDVSGLSALYGGTDGLVHKLDQFFSTVETGGGGTIHEMQEARAVRMGQLGMSNQPSHHIPYLYAAAGDPAKTQAAVREIQQRLAVGSEIGQGYLGDEDNGEMSSWFIFSALGFYPMAQGDGQYTIGSPEFTKATVHLENGKDLTIQADGNSTKNVYIASATLDGKALDTATVDESALRNGGTLRFQMTDEPTGWGAHAPTSTERVPRVDATKAGNGVASTSDGTPVASLFDDNSRSGATFATVTPSVTWSSESGPTAVASYTITNGASGAAPKSWTLSGSNDGDHWTALDERTDQTFRWATQTRPFEVASPTLYSQYRLTIDATSTGAPATVAELELLADTTVQTDEFGLYIAKGLRSTVGSAFTGAYATVTGGTSKDPADYDATVDFLDGNGPQKATVTRSNLGAMQVAVPHTYTAAGVYDARVQVKQGDSQASELATVTVARDGSLTGAYNAVCLVVKPAAGDCDGNGYAYDKTSLIASGFVPGSSVAVPGTTLSFDLPKVADGKPDTALARGQVIRTDLGDGATQFSVIGAANEKAQVDAPVTLTFDDGSTQVVKVSFGDWTGKANAPDYGNIVVGRSDNRPQGSGGDNQAAAIFASAPVAIDGGKKVVSVTLPNQTGTLKSGLLHVWAFASDGQRAPHADLAVSATSVAARWTGTAFTADLATATGGFPAGDGYTATVNWGDESPVTAGPVKDGVVSGTHTYVVAGTYTVHVTVDDGERSVVTTTTVTVKDPFHATISASPATVEPGAAVTVKGAGFEPGEDVLVTLSETPRATTLRALAALPTVKADAKGAFTTHVTVPSGAGDGTYPITAVGQDSQASASADVVVKVPLKATTTTLTVSSPRVAYGAPVTLTAAVTKGATGRVQFFEGSRSVGYAPVAGGRAVLTIDGLKIGRHSYTARYSGDEVFDASTSKPASVEVTRARVALGAPAFSKSSQVYGSPSVARVSVSVTGLTHGTVTFRSGSTVLGKGTIVRNGSGYKATASISRSLPAGSYRHVVAAVSATSTTDAATSTPSARTFTVRKATVSRVVVSGEAFRRYTHPRVTVTVGKVSNGSWPTGTVAIKVDGKVVTRVSLSAARHGRLTVTLPKTYRSTIRVQAVFTPGSTSVQGASSRTATVKVKR